MTQGCLVLVVGPSGAGKDTLLNGARAALEGDAQFVFPRREITRPAEAGGEDHIAVDTDTFQAARDSGAYALSWSAHGLGYGIPRAIETELAAGRQVVINVSRGVIAEARARYPGTQVVAVTAPAEVLAERLAGRGRESAEEILARLARQAPAAADGPNVWRIDNGGRAEAAIAEFVALLRRIASGIGS